MANVHVLALHGEIDISQKQWIEKELSQIETFGPMASTILDLSDVRYLDTTFLNALCRLRQRLLEEQPESALCVVTARNNFVSRLFGITQLDQRFHLFDDMSSARQYAYTARVANRSTHHGPPQEMVHRAYRLNAFPPAFMLRG